MTDVSSNIPDEGRVLRPQPGQAVDDVPLKPFHLRLAIGAAGGPFLDGYVLAILGVAMVQITPEFGLSATMVGVIGAMVLLGIFFGGAGGGILTDRYGRQRIYKWNIVVIAALSIASFWIDGAIGLIVARLLLGIAIGADYPISPALLAEFSPQKYRGPFLGALITLLFVGGAVAYAVGQIMLSVIGDDAWRWMLASSAVPALLILLLRIGAPESARWLAKQGRVDDANAVLERVFGHGVTTDELPTDAEEGRATLLSVFRAGYGGRLLFVTTIWTTLLIPVFAIYAFGPQLLAAMNLDGSAGTYGSAAIQLIFAVGCGVGLTLVNRLGRRTMLLHSFLWASVPLILLAIFTEASGIWVAILFATYALASGGAEVLCFVYPQELFPTEIRGSAMGLVTSLSRIGAAIGTFLVPISLTNYGISATMWGAAVISVIGLVAAALYAPETSGLTLKEASSLEP